MNEALRGWMRLLNGDYIRKYRMTDEKKARSKAFRAKECGIRNVLVEQDVKTGYWWVTLTHGAKPTNAANQYIDNK